MKLSPLQQYGIVTANYWAFTLTDGALRMLVVFHFHQLGYTTLEIAFLFLFYEFFGVVTNLYGGWIGARYGLRLTLWVGTLLQILSLLMLMPVAASWPKLLSVLYVMAAQAISGIAKVKASPAIDWTWTAIKGSCNQAIRKGGFELWKTAVFQMRESGIGEVTNPKPLAFRRHKDTDGHRKMSALSPVRHSYRCATETQTSITASGSKQSVFDPEVFFCPPLANELRCNGSTRT